METRQLTHPVSQAGQVGQEAAGNRFYFYFFLKIKKKEKKKKLTKKKKRQSSETKASSRRHSTVCSLSVQSAAVANRVLNQVQLRVQLNQPL